MNRVRVGSYDEQPRDPGGATHNSRGSLDQADMKGAPSRGAGTLTLNKLTVNQADVFPVSHIPHNEVRSRRETRSGTWPSPRWGWYIWGFSMRLVQISWAPWASLASAVRLTCRSAW